jgi:hypothetical protein
VIPPNLLEIGPASNDVKRGQSDRRRRGWRSYWRSSPVAVTTERSQVWRYEDAVRAVLHAHDVLPDGPLTMARVHRAIASRADLPTAAATRYQLAQRGETLQSVLKERVLEEALRRDRLRWHFALDDVVLMLSWTVERGAAPFARGIWPSSLR